MYILKCFLNSPFFGDRAVLIIKCCGLMYTQKTELCYISDQRAGGFSAAFHI